MWLIFCPFYPFLLSLFWFPPAAVADGVCHRAVPFLILEDRAGHGRWVSVTEGSSHPSPSLFGVNHLPPAHPHGFPGLFLPMGQVGRQVSAFSCSLRSAPAAEPSEYCCKYVHICVHNKRAGVYEW